MSYPCPCCGALGFTRPPGSLESCGDCGWIDDAAQLRFPLLGGVANRLNLWASQRAYEASDKTPRRRDPNWRALDRRRDFIEPECNDPDIDLSLTWPESLETLYYWRDDYWLRGDEQAYLYGRQCSVQRRSYAARELRDARSRLFEALRRLAGNGDGDAYAARASLNPLNGKALLHLAAFHQSGDFALDPAQQSYLRALAVTLARPSLDDGDAELARILAAAALACETP